MDVRKEIPSHKRKSPIEIKTIKTILEPGTEVKAPAENA